MQYPIGRFEWMITSGGFVCDNPKNTPMNLTMSNCYPNQFTCDSGHCIPLPERCDTVLTCEDKSDEVNCFYLQFNSAYAKETTPKVDNGKSPLPIYMNVSILAFPFIETVALKVTADFFLNLRWYDSRLDFRDLNVIHSLNSLSLSSMNQLWTPKLAFLNALGPYQTEVDKLSVGLLVREDSPLDEDITQEREGKTQWHSFHEQAKKFIFK